MKMQCFCLTIVTTAYKICCFSIAIATWQDMKCNAVFSTSAYKVQLGVDGDNGVCQFRNVASDQQILPWHNGIGPFISYLTQTTFPLKPSKITTVLCTDGPTGQAVWINALCWSRRFYIHPLFLKAVLILSCQIWMIVPCVTQPTLSFSPTALLHSGISVAQGLNSSVKQTALHDVYTKSFVSFHNMKGLFLCLGVSCNDLWQKSN